MLQRFTSPLKHAILLLAGPNRLLNDMPCTTDRWQQGSVLGCRTVWGEGQGEVGAGLLSLTEGHLNEQRWIASFQMAKPLSQRGQLRRGSPPSGKEHSVPYLAASSQPISFP